MIRTHILGVAAAAALAGALPLALPAAAQTVSTDYAAAPAGTYALDPAHTSVTLKVSHLGLSNYTMRLGDLKGGFTYDPAHPEASRITLDMNPAAIETGDAAFDRQIAADVLEAGRYPVLRFVSTAIKPGPEGRGQVVGDLTLHGQTHPVTLDLIFNGFTVDPKDHSVRMGFSGDASVKRSDFGATKYEPLVGDEVSVTIEAEFKK